VIRPFPQPTAEVASRAEVLLGYLDYYRSVLVERLCSLPEGALRSSRVPSGWTPLELLKHLTFVELRWLVWGFEGQAVPDPWGDRREDRWYVGPDESLASLLTALQQQAVVTREVVVRHDLQERGLPGERWDGAEPATLERVLLHLVQEYARHAGHLDIVVELSAGATGE
jgi:uncharacterized damage-inducible protein DinB